MVPRCIGQGGPTDALAGEVYLWNSKVTIGDNKATESDLSKAKKYLKDVRVMWVFLIATRF